MRRELMIIVAVGVVAVAVAGFVLIKGAGGSRSSEMAGGSQTTSPVAEEVKKPGPAASDSPAPPMVIRPLKREEPIAAAPPADRSENAASPSPAPLRDPVERTERPFALQPESGGRESTGVVTSAPTAAKGDPGADRAAPPAEKAVVIEPAMTASDPLPEPDSPFRPVPGPPSGGIPTAVRPAPVERKPDPAMPAAAEAAPPAAGAAPIMHTIAPGDTYSSLALKYLGSAKHANRISAANPDKDPRRLAVGTKIRIPATAQAGREVAAAPTGIHDRSPTAKPVPAPVSARPAGAVIPAPPTAPPPIAKGREYRVQPGEGWFDLAQRFLGDGRRWPELYELNRERVARNPSQLRSGTVIELPEGVTATGGGSASSTRPG